MSDPEKDPSMWPYATAIIMGIAGGIAAYLRRRRFSMSTFISEVFISGFVASMVFILFRYYRYDDEMCVFFAGVAGHSATRILFLLDHFAERRVRHVLEDKKEK